MGDVREPGQRRIRIDVTARMAQDLYQFLPKIGMPGEQRLCFLEGLIMCPAQGCFEECTHRRAIERRLAEREHAAPLVSLIQHLGNQLLAIRQAGSAQL